MQSLSVVISDAAITRHAADADIGELRDQRNPLLLRYRSGRQKATWYLVHYQNRTKTRHRLGYWPTLKTKDVVAMVPDVLGRLSAGHTVKTGTFETVGQLLEWYRGRTAKEVTKSPEWRRAVESAIDAHLLPLLGTLPVTQLTKAVLDTQLILPLVNSDLKPSTMRKYWGTLKTAVKLAAKLELLAADYMAGMKFVDHVTKRIKPKESRLRVTSLPLVWEQLQRAAVDGWALVWLMLLFGTRIGETRQLRWSYIDFTAGMVAIPAQITKTDVTHVLPITALAKEFLDQFRSVRESFGIYSDFLFPAGTEAISSQAAQKHIQLVSKGKWSAHDLRKMARSAWAELGIDYWMAERLLNHKPKGLDAVYIKTEALSERLKAVNVYHDWLIKQGLTVCTVQALKKVANA